MTRVNYLIDKPNSDFIGTSRTTTKSILKDVDNKFLCDIAVLKISNSNYNF